MVCHLRPLVYSLGLNNPQCICLTPRKSCVKNLWCNKQGNCRCKMAGAGIWSFTKFLGQMQRIATTGITSWQTALKWTADCQVPRSGCRGQVKPVAIHTQIHTSACGNPRDGYSILGTPRSKCRGLPQSVAHIWARNLARDWIPVHALLYRESPCLKRHIFLPRGFKSIKYLRSKLFRPKLNTNGLSWNTFLVVLYLEVVTSISLNLTLNWHF
jgi:hypothetical protein